MGKWVWLPPAILIGLESLVLSGFAIHWWWTHRKQVEPRFPEAAKPPVRVRAA